MELLDQGPPRRVRVTAHCGGATIAREYSTVLFAIGREPCTKRIGLEKAGVQLNPKTGKIMANNLQTTVENIYAVGDVLDGHPELASAATQSGNRLAYMLFGELKEKVNVFAQCFGMHAA